jgi:hypothetical protein
VGRPSARDTIVSTGQQHNTAQTAPWRLASSPQPWGTCVDVPASRQWGFHMSTASGADASPLLPPTLVLGSC